MSTLHSIGNASPEICSPQLLFQRTETVAAENPHLMLGMLVEIHSRKYALVLTDYFWDSHSGLFAYVAQKHDVKELLWAGELLMSHSENSTSIGQVLMTVNTSGYAMALNSEMGGKNSPEAIADLLKRFRPDLLGPGVMHLEFSILFPHLSPFFRELSRQCLMECKGKSVRHQFLNLLTAGLTFFSPNSLPAGYSWSKELRDIENDFPAHEVRQFLLFLTELMSTPNGAVSSESLQVATANLQKFVRHEIKSETDFNNLIQSMFEIEKQVRAYDYERRIVLLN